MAVEVIIMKTGRNDVCSCGSGKKYKKCCFNKASTIELQIKSIRKKTKPLHIQISEDENLYDLHTKILAKNKWLPEHAFSFFMSDEFRDAENEYVGNPFEICNSGVKVKKFNFKKGDTFLYLYDYGNEHRFEITVLSIV
jgi:hypothetical protein